MHPSDGTQAGALRALAELAAEIHGGSLRGMLGAFADERLRAADRADAEAWERLATKAGWESFRAPRMAALRASLGDLPAEAKTTSRITRSRAGDGYSLHGLVYQSRAGDPVSANLYLPEPRRERMPGILICHSHHRPKVQGEIQDMGMTWARAGCAVLAPDLPSYGERRHQPFEGRQEYYFRYFLGMQLQLAGESLIGRIVWDLWRGVDALLAQPGVDASRVFLMGAVAGGGDPTAVAAALDERIACAVPFNFGGPQPETVVSSEGEARAFRYAGSGGWESTRNLRLSAHDGFLPWAIVGAVAPRALVYAHEFEWEADVDPVWARLQRIYGWHGAEGRIGAVKGKGRVTQAADVATHCNQIGAVHRAQIYPLLAEWFGAEPPREYTQRLEPADLDAFTPEVPRTPIHLQARAAAEARIAACRAALEPLPIQARAAELCARWSKALLLPEARAPKILFNEPLRLEAGPPARRVTLETEPGIRVPLLLLAPNRPSDDPAPVAVAFAQQGQAAFLKERAEDLAALLAQGVAVCLPDLRGFGASDPDGDRSWYSRATAHSSSELMLGRTQLGSQLHDLRAVLAFLCGVSGLDGRRAVLWGDSFAPVNSPDYTDPPLRTQPAPAIGEPAAGLLALLGALFDEHVRGAYARGTLASWLDVFATPFVYLPHDFLVPGATAAGDLSDLRAVLGRHACLSEPIDGRNVALAQGAPVAPVPWIAQRLDARL